MTLGEIPAKGDDVIYRFDMAGWRYAPESHAGFLRDVRRAAVIGDCNRALPAPVRMYDPGWRARHRDGEGVALVPDDLKR